MTPPALPPPKVGDRKVFHFRDLFWTWEIVGVSPNGGLLTVKSDQGAPGHTMLHTSERWADPSLTPGVVRHYSDAMWQGALGPGRPAAPQGPAPLSEWADDALEALAVDATAPAGRRMAARKILDARQRAR